MSTCTTKYNIQAGDYDIPVTVSGNTWKGMTLIFDQDITDWIFRMWVLHPQSGKALLKFNSEEGNPTITDAVNGVVVWEPQLITLDPAVYPYDIKIEKPDGSFGTYIKGNWIITKGKTQ